MFGNPRSARHWRRAREQPRGTENRPRSRQRSSSAGPTAAKRSGMGRPTAAADPVENRPTVAPKVRHHVLFRRGPSAAQRSDKSRLTPAAHPVENRPTVAPRQRNHVVVRRRRPNAKKLSGRGHLHGELVGGEGGIRTRGGLLTHAPLARECLRPLGHLSKVRVGLVALSPRRKPFPRVCPMRREIRAKRGLSRPSCGARQGETEALRSSNCVRTWAGVMLWPPACSRRVKTCPRFWKSVRSWYVTEMGF